MAILKICIVFIAIAIPFVQAYVISGEFLQQRAVEPPAGEVPNTTEERLSPDVLRGGYGGWYRPPYRPHPPTYPHRPYPAPAPYPYRPYPAPPAVPSPPAPAPAPVPAPAPARPDCIIIVQAPTTTSTTSTTTTPTTTTPTTPAATTAAATTAATTRAG